MVLRPFAQGYTCTPAPPLFTSRAIGDLSLCLSDWEQEKSDITLWSWLKGFFFSFFSTTFIEIAVLLTKGESKSLDTIQVLSKGKGWWGELSVILSQAFDVELLYFALQEHAGGATGQTC